LQRQASSAAEEAKLQVTDAANAAGEPKNVPVQDLLAKIRTTNKPEEALEPVVEAIKGIRAQLNSANSNEDGKQAFLKFVGNNGDNILQLMGRAMGDPKRMNDVPWMEQSIGTRFSSIDFHP
jgi:hypothetical protein